MQPGSEVGLSSYGDPETKKDSVQLTLALVFLNPLISIRVLDTVLNTLVSTTWVVTDHNINFVSPNFLFVQF